MIVEIEILGDGPDSTETHTTHLTTTIQRRDFVFLTLLIEKLNESRKSSMRPSFVMNVISDE